MGIGIMSCLDELKHGDWGGYDFFCLKMNNECVAILLNAFLLIMR